MLNGMLTGRSRLSARFALQPQDDDRPMDYIGRHRATEVPIAQQAIMVPAQRPQAAQHGTAVIA